MNAFVCLFSLPENAFFTVLLFLQANFVTWALDPLSCRSKGHVSLMNSFLHFQSLPSYWCRSFRSQVAHVLLLFSALPNVTTYWQTIQTSCNPLSDLCSSEIALLKGERPPGHHIRKPFLCYPFQLRRRNCYLILLRNLQLVISGYGSINKTMFFKT